MADELTSELEEQDGIVAPPEGDGGEPPVTKTVEDYARERGWKPQEEWSGEGEWRDAETFLTFGLERARDLNRDVKHLRENIDQLSRTQRQEADRAAQRARTEEKQRWEQLLSVAVQEGDEGKAFEATQKIAEISVQPVTSPQGDPLVAQFVADNAWFTSDPIAKSVAVAAADVVTDAGGSVADQLKAAKEAVHKRFPEYAPTPATPPKVVDVARPGSRLASPGNRAKGFADLSADQQMAARYLVQQGKIANVEAYVKQAFNTEGTIE